MRAAMAAVAARGSGALALSSARMLACTAGTGGFQLPPRQLHAGATACARSVHTSPSAAGQNTQQSGSSTFSALAGLSALGASLFAAAGVSFSEQKQQNVFRREEIARHTTMDTGVWVTYKGKVYDITDFIANHPGGADKIILAAGKDVEAFWHIYRQHYNSDTPLKIMEELQIGVLHPDDVKAEAAQKEALDKDNPYAKDPDRHPALKVHAKTPCNAETPKQLLADQYVTPAELWFVRNHHPVPDIDSKTWKLCVKGEGILETKLTLEDLKTRFKKHEVTSTIQCGGNRRSGLDQISKTAGTGWDTGAISTAVWSGVLLSDVLQYCGLTDESCETAGVKHVQFQAEEGLQASIPVEKAIRRSGDVLLAYEMNGEAIPRDHGFPVRVIVPGHVGVRNVKWLNTIITSAEEATGPWQRGMAYKGFSPSVKDLKGIQVDKIASIQEQPVQSVILSPMEGTAVSTKECGPVTISGYAYSGGGRGIVRVDVSIDGGKTWETATLKEGSEQDLNRAWAWTFWEVDVEIPPEMKGKKIEVVCKATDASYNVQPESVEPIWNLRGLNNTSWHRVPLQVEVD
mmetsp:Transcript_9427/g.34598  ORF Transcript_9427/g.34598 Transcript_9427/m.34598 type:complete len:574 (-) Transcript_9427:105-1826(-)